MTKTIVSIQVLDAEKRRIPSKHYVYTIVVKWTDSSSIVVYRRYSRFFDLQTQLLDKFPIEAGTTDPSLRIIPFLPGKIFFGRSQIRDVAMKRLTEIDAYCKALLALPPHISQCEEVLEFFEVEPDDIDPPVEDSSKHKGEKRAEKISRPKQLEQFVAVADYEAQEKGEMQLTAGMLVEVTEKSESGWWFVNAEQHQGWVPSTYLQPTPGSPVASQATCASNGEEEKYICIEKFAAENADEISLEKGVIVEVQQKNMDGWWMVKYQGREGIAPATYLKKSNDPHAKLLIEGSRHSGVQIISNLADVSNLLVSSSSPRNSGIFVEKTPNNKAAGGAGGEEEERSAEEKEGMDTVGEPPNPTGTAAGPKGEGYSAVVMMKQRSLERGGSLKPPPRQNSITKSFTPTPPTPPGKPSPYVTIADFEDTVGDGISFVAGETVTVLEKTSSGWWFVERGTDQGWVPESYLEKSDTPQVGPSADDTEEIEKESDEFEDSDEEYVTLKPPSQALASALNSRLEDSKPSTVGGPVKPPAKAMTSKPPPPPVKPQDQSQEEQNQPASGLASALKSRFESKSTPAVVPAGKPSSPGLPRKPGKKPSLPQLPHKTEEKPSLPQLPLKPSEKASQQTKPEDKSEDNPTPSTLGVKKFHKPLPPGKHKKPAAKADSPERTEAAETNCSPGVAGIASALKSKFENHQLDSNRPAKPPGKPSQLHPKPSPPSKPGKKPDPPSKQGKPPGVHKPSLPQHGGKPQLPAAGRGAASPHKLPSKPGSDPNNNSSSADRRKTSKVHDMVAAFGNSVGNAGAKPALPGKKPATSHASAPKPAPELAGTDKPKVSNLVSALGSKLHFDSGGGGGDGGKGSRESLDRSPESKSAPWSKKSSHTEESPVAQADISVSGAEVTEGSAVSGSQADVADSEGAEYEVVADFAGEGAGELDLRCGDIVQVLKRDQQDWWLVTFRGQEGWAPSSYLEPAPQWDD